MEDEGVASPDKIRSVTTTYSGRVIDGQYPKRDLTPDIYGDTRRSKARAVMLLVPQKGVKISELARQMRNDLSRRRVEFSLSVDEPKEGHIVVNIFGADQGDKKEIQNYKIKVKSELGVQILTIAKEDGSIALRGNKEIS
jgi:hypothetical protein